MKTVKNHRKFKFSFAIALVSLIFISLFVLMGFGILSKEASNLNTIGTPSSLLYIPATKNHLIEVSKCNISPSGAFFSVTNIGDKALKIENVSIELADGTKMYGEVNPGEYKLVQGETKGYFVSGINCIAGQSYNITKKTIVYEIIKNPRETEITENIVEGPFEGVCPE